MAELCRKSPVDGAQLIRPFCISVTPSRTYVTLERRWPSTRCAAAQVRALTRTTSSFTITSCCPRVRTLDKQKTIPNRIDICTSTIYEYTSVHDCINGLMDHMSAGMP